MKIKLIDIRVDNYEEQLGTCEMCFWTAYLDHPVYVFEDSFGKIFDVKGYWWDWGDYSEVFEWHNLNVLDFAEFVANQDVDALTEFDTDWLISVQDAYYNEKDLNRNSYV